MKSASNIKPQGTKFVALGKMFTCPDAQRTLNTDRVNALVADFDPDLLGMPVVSIRDDEHVAVIDGQHRVRALAAFLGDGWEAQQIECRYYTGLTVAQEADLFLHYNNTLNVTTYTKFMVGVTAGRPDETAVKNIAARERLIIGKNRREGAVACVGALMAAYRMHGAEPFGRTLRVIREAYGTAGFESTIVTGMAMVCARYGRRFEEPVAVRKLSALRGGPPGLIGRARQARDVYACTRAQAMAVAIVDTVNSRGGLHLPGWWEPDETPKTPRATVRKAATAEARA